MFINIFIISAVFFAQEGLFAQNLLYIAQGILHCPRKTAASSLAKAFTLLAPGSCEDRRGANHESLSLKLQKNDPSHGEPNSEKRT